MKRMASLYAVLVEADTSKQLDQEKKERTRNTGDERPTREKKTSAVIRAPGGAPTTPNYGAKNSSQGYQQAPGININLQVHISADATSDQIDQIFASMAKHIYQRG